MTKFAQPGRRIDIGRDRDAFRLHVRETVLVAAASILRNDGPAALTLRRVAQDVGASTKVIYTTFGGKDGLFDALYLRSYAGLQAAMEMASSAQDTETRLRSICDAYRDYALAEPGFYNVMYGDLGRSWQAPPGKSGTSWADFSNPSRGGRRDATILPFRQRDSNNKTALGSHARPCKLTNAWPAI